MKQIHLYSLSRCPFCVAAKSLLEERGWRYSETVVDNRPDLWQEMVERSRGNTAPQIFFGDHCIGGFTEMMELDKKQELENLLI